MLILASGSAASKALALVSLPLITRLYNPEDFGVLSIFIAITAILLPFSTLKYTTAIPLPKKDSTAINLIFLILIISVLVSIFIFIIFLFFKDNIFYFFSIEKLIDYWWLIPLSVFFFSLYETFNFWFTRKMQFKLLSKNLFFQTFLGILIKILFGSLSFTPIGLIVGQVIGQSAGVVILIYKFLSIANKKVKLKYILFVQKYYIDFPKYKMPSHFLYILSFQAPLLFTSILYGVEATGQLGLAFSVLAVPMTLFGQTTSQAYYSEISKIGNKEPEKIYDLTKEITRKLFFISLLPFFILLFFAPILFEIIFGKNWIEAGNFSQVLSIFLISQFISSPFMQVFNVMKKQIDVLFIHLRRLIFVIIIFLTGYIFKLSIFTLITTYSIVLSLHYLIVYFQVIKIIKNVNLK